MDVRQTDCDVPRINLVRRPSLMLVVINRTA